MNSHVLMKQMLDPVRVEEIFAQAVNRPTPQECAAWLDTACGADAELRARVEQLLAAHGNDANFLPIPASTDEPPPVESAGLKIGRYQLLEQIGEGGFGVVFMAEQTSPVRRRVALKIIKLGMDTKQVVARFEAERQALAMMDHPNVARVFDGGATETGRPYFVMELVKGTPITAYCDQHNLNIRERLALFGQVCQAVQHAHQKGIIHRDIKPTNVLVAAQDDRAVVKVIDFGIAKATEARLTERTLFTEFRQWIGTPQYMSPEQADGILDVDTRSDVYSLGVLLYELLTGATPFEAKALREQAYEEIRRIIREVEPPRPSTRLSHLDTLPSVAATRQIEPRKLQTLVRGELDWIVMRCLEKDRTRRYQTARELCDDVERYLRDDPVQARPASMPYRFRKFARRNKSLLAITAMAAAVLIAAVVILAISTVTITRERNRTAKALVEREQALATAREKEAFASQQATLAQRRFYAAQVNLANQAIEAGFIARGMELLETLQPKVGETDMRTFEWFHLHARCNARHLLTIRADAEGVGDIDFSSDGRLLASSGYDNTLRLWDAQTGRAIRTVSANAYLGQLMFLPGDATIASIDNTWRLRRWDVATGAVLQELGTRGASKTIALSPDGRLLAIGGWNDSGGLVCLWDQSKATTRPTTLRIPGQVSVLTFSPDSKTLVIGMGGPVATRWNVSVDPPQKLGDLAGGMQATFASDGKTLATAEWGIIRLLDTTTWQPTNKSFAHNGYITGLRYTSDQRALISAGQDRTILRWDLPGGATTRPTTAPTTFPARLVIGAHNAPITSISVSPDGQRLAVSDMAGLIQLWDISPVDPSPITVFRHGTQTLSLLQLGDGRLLSTAIGSGARLWDEQGRAVGSFAAAGRAVLLPDRKHLVCSSDDGRIELWDLATLQKLAAIEANDGKLYDLAISPDGRTVATCSGGNLLRLWNITPEGFTHQADVDIRYGAASMAFSADGKILAVGGQESLILLDRVTGGKRLVPSGDKGFHWTRATVFSPDGKLLATAGDVGVAQIRDAATGAILRELKGHSNGIPAIAFSPDGQTLATGSGDKTIRLWDVLTGQERLSFGRYTDTIVSLSFSPDGERLYSASGLGTIRIFHAPRQPSGNAEFLRSRAESVPLPAVPPQPQASTVPATQP
jgi:WD40 repeat protein/serine/threonine protein kinase